jgi:hypothetical protein
MGGAPCHIVSFKTRAGLAGDTIAPQPPNCGWTTLYWNPWGPGVASVLTDTLATPGFMVTIGHL